MDKEDRNMLIGILICVFGFIVFFPKNESFTAGVTIGVFVGVGASSIWLTIKTIFTESWEFAENLEYTSIRWGHMGLMGFILKAVIVFSSLPIAGCVIFFIAPIVGIVRFIKRRRD